MRAADFLTKIIEDKKKRLARARVECPPDRLRVEALRARERARPHALYGALSTVERFNVIAEIKRASPSKGVIRGAVEPAELARLYEAGGAVAISVLTEEDHFRGSLEDLRGVRAAVELPLLRKDFIFEEYQLYEAAAAGADALLLIVAALDVETLRRLRRLTEDELEMDALVEVHTPAEMCAARDAGAKIIGVNNRDLRTFHVSLDVSRELAAMAPPASGAGALRLVSESGLSAGADLASLRAQGFSGFLIGETLMRSERPEETLRALLDEANGSLKRQGGEGGKAGGGSAFERLRAESGSNRER